MKSFLDRFKRRDPDERAPEVASERVGKAGAPADKPAPAIHVVSLEAESKALDPSAASLPAAASPLATVADNEVRLELGDFLHRIPQNLLRPGPHDVSLELRFGVTELSNLIARGQTSINLADLYTRIPGIFRAEVRMEDNVEVRFPWQKLMSVVKGVGSTPVGKMGITQAAAEALAQKLRSRRPTRNISPGSPTTGVVAKSQPAAAQESVPGQTGKLGTCGRQPAWVNKSASEKAPSEALVGSVPSVNVEAPVKPETAAPSSVDSPPTDARGGVNQEELIRDGDAANLKYEEANADFQRQIAALTKEREAIAANGEAMHKELAEKAAELEQLRNEIAALKKSSDERFAAISAERETLAHEHDNVVADREAARKELGGKTSELEALKNELAVLTASSAEKIASLSTERDKFLADFERGRGERQESADMERLVAERDALKKDLAEKGADFEALKAQLAALTQSSDEKIPALTGEHARIAAELQRAREELAARDEKIAFQQELSAKSAEDAVKLVSEREALRKEIAAKTSEIESIKTELALLRQGAGKKYAAIAGDRDKVLADLKRTREELADKVEQIELEHSLVTRTGEDFAKANADREALRKELEAKTGELELTRRNLEGKIAEVEVQQRLNAKAAEEAARLTAECEALRRDLAVNVNAFESLKSEAAAKKKDDEKPAALTREQDALTKERDKVTSDFNTTGEELAARLKENEKQQGVAARSSAEAARLAAEREALEKQLAARTSEWEELKDELALLATLKKESDEKLAALAQERDTLVQQKSGLAEQLATATERLATRQKTVVGVGLSKKENQRQIEELQRRIMAFESSQRETAQELSRERETRIKAERSLAAAERARHEATALIESLRVETRREYENAARKREAEFARAQQELQEKLGALVEVQQKTVSERDELAATIQKVREEAAATAAAAKDAFWESRAVASLEEDIANYRARIKTLILEREEATREAARISAAHAQAASEQTGLNHARQAQELAAARATVETTEATVADLRHQLDKLVSERDNMQADWEKLFVELDAVKAQAREQAEIDKSGNAANSDLQRQVAELKNSLDLVTREQGGLQQTLSTARAEYEHALARFDSERTAFAQTRTELENRVANAERETNEIVARANALASTVQAREEELRERNAELKRLAEAHEQALADRDRDRELRSFTEAKDQELAALTAELESMREEHEAQNAVFAREFKAVVEQRDDAIAAAESTQLELQEKESALACEKAALERAEVNAASRLEREVVRLRRERDQLARHRDDLHTRVARMIDEQREILNELAAQSVRQGPPPNDVIQKPREPREANVIEITTAEIVAPCEPECGINLPRIHPLPIPPPNLRVL